MTHTEDASAFDAEHPTPLLPYAKRHFRFAAVLERDAFRIKLYTIRLDPEPVAKQIVDAAAAYTLERLPRAADEESDHHDLGFAILHEGEQAVWLLLHWWAHGDICCQRMALAAHGVEFVETDRPFHACVWEGAVITHEHRAWIDTMLTEEPDPERYVASVLPDGAY